MVCSTTPPSTPIYVPSTVASAEEWWTSLRADSRARTSASLDTELDSTGIEAVFGGRCLDAFGTWDPDTFSLRTYQASFWADKPDEWLESFPRSGTIRSGTAYRLRPLVPPTYDGGGGALGLKPSHHVPTPTVATTYTGNLASTQIDFESNHSVDLAQWVAKWPTPTSRDHKDGDAHSVQNTPVNGLLGWAVHMWGAPRSEMVRSASIDRNKSNLEEQVGHGKLNPDWVSWLMGLPIGWTRLDPLSREEYDQWFQAQVNGTWWTEERGLPRVGTDIPDRVQRLTTLGNGIVPGVVARFIDGMAYD
jgi:hypothetical protein